MGSDLLRIGLVGDRDDAVTAHRAIPVALQRAADEVGVSVEARWLPTETIVAEADVAGFDGIWCVPASPYRSMDGALRAQTAPDAGRAVIAPLGCALVEAIEDLQLRPGSRVAAAYGAQAASEGYHCRYGLNPVFARELTRGPLRAAAYDAAGQVRAVELDGHPFFVATRFQPERLALRNRTPPLARAFVSVCSRDCGDGATR